MPIIIGERTKIGQTTPYYKRMIRCPGHWLVSPKVDVYLREPVDILKNSKNEIEYKGKLFKIKKNRIKRDRFGQKMIDWKKMYEYRKTGLVLNPPISASEAIERIYDPKGYLCQHCDKRCLEGKGGINIGTIRRLRG